MTPEIEFLNTDQRAILLVLCDTSGSTAGEPNRHLNEGLRVLRDEIAADPVASRRIDLAIVTFGDNQALIVQDFVNATAFEPPTLAASGNTPMGLGIHTGLDLIEQRKRSYREQGIEYLRPMVLLDTDGMPTDDWTSAAERVHREESDHKIMFFAVGFGDVNMVTLTQIAPPNRPPVRLDGLKFRELFQWVSASQRRISMSKSGNQVALPPITGWAATTP